MHSIYKVELHEYTRYTCNFNFIFPNFSFLNLLKVSKSRVVVSEKGPLQEITVTSTLPVTCDSQNSGNCKLEIELDTSGNVNGGMLFDFMNFVMIIITYSKNEHHL